VLELFEHFGVKIESVARCIYKMDFHLLSNPDFPIPVLRREGLTATTDRNKALNREDIEFLSWDHPMICGAMDLILGSEKGNCTCVLWQTDEPFEMLLEAVFVLECIAPRELYIDRFLPPTPIRILLNQKFQESEINYRENQLNNQLKYNLIKSILENPDIKQNHIPEMLDKCREFAEERSLVIKDRGLKDMKNTLEKEYNRLIELKKINNNIRDDEIICFKQEIEDLSTIILSARLRLDALRLIFKGNVLA
jgi:ATP-dependent helicase HepA